MPVEAPQDPNSSSLAAKVTGMALRFVARQFRSKPLALRNAPPVVSFTFDDVPASACEMGADILERHGARGTFYVSGGGCGTVSPGGPLRASIDQLRTIWANGHEIGCHTYSHPAVRHMSLDELGSELDRNQSVLKNINSDIVVRNFAYPYGDMSVRTKRYLEVRFDSCRSGHAGINTVVADLGSLNAWPLENASLDRAKIVKLIAETVETKGWLIFYSHDVAEQPSRFGVSPDLLECAVGTAKRAGCALTTIAEGLKLVGGPGIEAGNGSPSSHHQAYER
jgi:peptidoglycan/xylan/chitin deacetylase (PgdA/CDA1 family)